MASLPADEIKLLGSSDFLSSEMSVDSEADLNFTEPAEMLFYQQLKEKSHPPSLVVQLQFLMDPELRRQAELYISQNAPDFGYKNLNTRNLAKASDFAVANLYFYFQDRDESEEEEEAS